MKFREARRSDKEEILSFCVDTFSWGDYIDRVWDQWFKRGRLLVVEDEGKKIAMSHVAICPDSKEIWLEGVRVRPDYRRSRIATNLLEKMIGYGRRRGAKQASAIVDVTNIASQRMMKKNGFSVVARWAYYGAESGLKEITSHARLATISELGEIWKYLQNSDIYRLSAKRYVRSWHWYTLDKKALRGFIRGKSVVVTGRRVDGVAIINSGGYWDRKNVMQVIYLDAATTRSLQHLFSMISSLCFERSLKEFQIVCPDNKLLTSFIGKCKTNDEEHFLLYNKVFTAKASPSR